MVPEGVEEFSIESGFPHSRGRITIWNPDGGRAWNYAYHSATHENGDRVRADVAVDPEHAGKLWRIGVPGHNAGPVEFDPQIPPVFSTDRDRWFMPAELEVEN